MKSSFLVLIFIFCFTSFLSAQEKYGLLGQSPQNEGSLILGIGPANLLGDAGGAYGFDLKFIRDFKLRDTRVMVSLGFRQRFNQYRFAWKGLFQYGHFVGDDADFRNAGRGYAFESNLAQLSLQGEYNFLQTRFTAPFAFRFYGFTGIGGVYSSSVLTKVPSYPRPNDKKKDAEIAAFLPLGVGLELKLSKKLRAGAELYWSYYFSDYLDGLIAVESKSNDALFGLSFYVGYSIFGSDEKRNQSKCCCSWR